MPHTSHASELASIESELTCSRKGTSSSAAYKILRKGKDTGFTAHRNDNEAGHPDLAWCLHYQDQQVYENGTRKALVREVAKRLAGLRPLEEDMT